MRNSNSVLEFLLPECKNWLALPKAEQRMAITVKKADEELKEKCKSWPTWGCEASTFPWTYSQNEDALVLEGEVIVTPDGGGAPVEIKAGDYCTFPKGMSCTWEVKKAIQKHYNFH